MANIEVTHNPVSAYFSTPESAETAVRELRSAGFTRNQISLAGTPEGHWRADEPIRNTDSETAPEGNAYNEGHKASAAVGGFWQRIKSMFEGEPGDPYAAETPLIATDAGDTTPGDRASHEITGTYDYDANDFHQTWGAAQLPEDRSRYFSDRWARTGQGVLVSVAAGDRRAKAAKILEDNGADLGDTRNDLAEEVEIEGAVATGTTLGVGQPLAASTEANLASSAEFGRPATDRNPQRIQLYGEVLRVHRERLQQGEVRVRKEIVTEYQTIEVPITREELVLERIPVTGETTAAGVRLGESEEVRIPLSGDRISIEKEPVVREEVLLGKREVSDVESREEPVRHEELRVEDQDRLRKAS
jgi:uncharacterized protein (TIGR02271 family)